MTEPGLPNRVELDAVHRETPPLAPAEQLLQCEAPQLSVSPEPPQVDYPQTGSEQAPRSAHRLTRRSMLIATFVLPPVAYALSRAVAELGEETPKATADRLAVTKNAYEELGLAQNKYALPPTDTAEKWQSIIDGHVEGLWDGVVGDNVVRIPGALPGGRVAFFISDHINSKGKMKHNTIVIVNPDGTASAMTPDTEVIPNPPSIEVIPGPTTEVFYWPGSTMVVDNDDGSKTMYVSATRVKHTDNPDPLYAFEVLGKDIAVFTIANTRNAVPVFSHMMETPSSNQPMTEGITWWVSASMGEDGYVYVDGSEDVAGGLLRNLYRSRIKSDVFKEKGATGEGVVYEYWTGKPGNLWSTNPADAKPLINATAPKWVGLDAGWVSSTIKVNGQNVDVIISKDGTYGETILACTSKDKESQYKCQVVYTIPKKPYTNNGQVNPNVATVTYAANLLGIVQDPHTGKLRLLITYSNNASVSTPDEIRNNASVSTLDEIRNNSAWFRPTVIMAPFDT